MAKEWYLDGEYSKKEIREILERTRTLLFDISLSDDVTPRDFKRIGKITKMLIELQFIDVKEEGD